MALGLSVEIDDRDALVYLNEMNGRVRAALLTAEQALEAELVDRVRGRAHVRTGAYRASIDGDVAATATGVIASVWAGVFYAHILEDGATLPARTILPNVEQALHFMDDAHEVFAKVVHWPGAKIKPENILSGALAEMDDEIVAALEAAINNATGA